MIGSGEISRFTWVYADVSHNRLLILSVALTEYCPEPPLNTFTDGPLSEKPFGPSHKYCSAGSGLVTDIRALSEQISNNGATSNATLFFGENSIFVT